MGKSENRGQHDRASGIDPEGPAEDILGAMRVHLTSQEQKWNQIGPAVEQYLGRAPARILDVGSSVGNASIALSFRYPEAEVIGFELEPEAVELARILARDRKQCRFVCAPIETIGSKHGTFDFIHCANLLEHVDDPKIVVDCMLRVLAPGGVMLISCPNYLFPWECHIRSWMLPGGPKPLLKWILRMRGDRNTSFIDHLRLEVNTIRVKKWLRSAGDLEWRDLAPGKVEEILTGEDNGLFNPGLVGRIKALHLSGLIISLARVFPVMPSVLLLVKKRAATHSANGSLNGV
jgi:2-polyprenyl-3-methyl-5-hydroxy-6-metoxy-1,4-benzoquinol methylase